MPSPLTLHEINLLIGAKISPAPRILVQRSVDNSPSRWFAWPAGVAMINKKNQIDSTQLYDNLIRRMNITGQYPYLTFFHLGAKARLGQADWVQRAGYGYYMSGTFDDNSLSREVSRTLENDTTGYWGTSICYYPIGPQSVIRWNDTNVLVYNDGIQEEVSILPAHLACSHLTRIPTIRN